MWQFLWPLECRYTGILHCEDDGSKTASTADYDMIAEDSGNGSANMKRISPLSGQMGPDVHLLQAVTS